MRRNSLFILVPITAAFIAGCGDSSGLDLTPRLVAGTAIVAAPIAGNEELPTALDVTADGAGGIFGGRFPERVADAEAWDFAVRIRDGQLVLIPARGIGVESSAQLRASITRALSGETFAGLREAPGQSTFVSDSAVVLTEGAVYVARSRDVISRFGSACPQYAKLSPLDVDVETGRATIDIVTNVGCADPRLVPE